MYNAIVEWNKNRNNTEFVRTNEFAMLHEELMELMSATNDHEEVDALCDLIVIATGAIWKLGYDPELSMIETLREINSRKQDPIQKAMWKAKGISGKWLKHKEQDPSTLYKADYDKAKL